MTPLRILGATHVFKAPPGLEDKVRDLHVLRAEGCYVSRWEPTPGELETLMQGGSVELWVMGAQPPVMLTVAQPAHAPTWALDRMDDNGNVFTMLQGLSKRDADHMLAHYTEHGHKQTYTIREE